MPNKVKLVRYIGQADIRSISEAEWSAAGVKNQKATQWDKSCLVPFTLPGDRFNADAIRYFKTDPEFALVEDESE